ncbi:Vanin C-terminal domain [Popillia japonica]|uniref:Vanin C-terminal domain n=1 Tax=Popillia japonica TaxID=7064 RepID=A0AAW1IU37_POPJA
MMFKYLLAILFVATAASAQTYTAAVLEYSPQTRDAAHSDIEYVMTNVWRYVDFIQQAVVKQANIVIFPEYGLTTTILPANLFDISSVVPNASLRISPCNDRSNYTNFLVDLSCAANEHNIHVVVNLIERETNNSTNVTLYYNTNVVFDTTGAVIARYRKINLFNEPQLTAGNEVVTFQALDVTFGLFTCFDILFRRPAQDVLLLGATDIIYTTAWTSETPFHHSFSIQDGYAKAAGVNLLVAGYSNVTNGMAGAAIFGANATILAHSFTPAAAQNIFTAQVPRITARTPQAVCDSNQEIAPRIGLLPEISSVLEVMHENLNLYTFQNLEIGVNTTSGRICAEETEFCCDYNIEFNVPLTNASTIYRMVAFFGRRGFQDAVTSVNTIGVRTCALLRCTTEDNLSCGRFNATTNVNFRRVTITTNVDNIDSFYQPSTLSINHEPLTNFVYCAHGDVNAMTHSINIENSQDLFAFGIFGRVFRLDGQPEGRGGASSVYLSFIAIVTAYLCLILQIMLVESVLVEYEDLIDKKIYANSGCLIANTYVIITSNILVSTITKVVDWKSKLQALKGGFSTANEFFKAQPELNVVINSVNPYRNKTGRVLAIYTSEFIKRELTTYFKDWTVDEDDKAKQVQDFLPVFFIIALNDEGFASGVNNFLKSMNEVIDQNSQIRIGQKIIIDGTPFGNRYFLRTRSKGIVSNLFGPENCFILTDTPTAPGSEGSPIFLKSKTLTSKSPIGIVLASLTWWKGEWIGLSLGGTLSGIFSEITTKKIREIGDLDQVCYVLKHSLVQVVSGSSWGSGILLDKENGLFITNSHVIESSSPTLFWQDIKIKSDLVYKSGDNEVYDLAILQGDLRILNETKMTAVKISTDKILTGETAFAAGFPLFPQTMKPKPTLTKGCISHVTPGMIKTTCSVLPGSSGGAILRKSGELVGIIVCNTRMDDSMSAVPRINMAVPIGNVIDVILNYLETKDVAVLEMLKVNDLSVRKEWNFVGSKL